MISCGWCEVMLYRVVKYHRRIYFCVRQIFDIFAYQSQSHVNPRSAGSGRSPCCCGTMVLLHFFKPVNGHLPDPTSPLADIPPPTIHQVNLRRCLVGRETRCQHEDAGLGLYSWLTDKQRVQIGKYASENGNAAAARRFSKELERPLNKSTNRSIKKTTTKSSGKSGHQVTAWIKCQWQGSHPRNVAVHCCSVTKLTPMCSHTSRSCERMVLLWPPLLLLQLLMASSAKLIEQWSVGLLLVRATES